MAKIFIGLDDTDTEESRWGTGHLARLVMDDLSACQVATYGVSRHQLLFDRRIPYTAKNSANVVHISGDTKEIPFIADRVEQAVRANFQPGSDPGFCIGLHVSPEVVDFGQRAQREILTQQEAITLAQKHGLLLRGLGGDNGGVIGALAGIGLASSGNDGRFTCLGRTRDLTGIVSVAEILAAGIDAVQTMEGIPVTAGQVETCDKIRPSLRNGQATLYVEKINGYWRALRLD